MDELKIVELETRLKAQEAEMQSFRRRLERMTIALDECRRRVNLSSIIDEQVATINSRVNERAMS